MNKTQEKVLHAFFKNTVFTYWPYISIMVFCTLIYAFFFTIQPYLIKEIVDILEGHNNSNFSYTPFFIFCGLSLLNLIFFQASTRLYESYINIRLFPKMRKKIYEYMFNYLIEHSHSFFQKNSTGDLSQKIKDVVESMAEFLRLVVDSILANTLTLISSFILLYLTSKIFALMLLIWLIIFFIYSYFSVPKIIKISEKNAMQSSRLNGHITDVLRNIFSVRLFHRYDYEKNLLSSKLDDLVFVEKKMEIMYAHLWDVYRISFTTTNVIAYYFVFSSFFKNEISLGDITMIWALTGNLASFVWQFARDLADFPRLWGKIVNATSSIFVKYEIEDKENAKELKIKNGKIEFKNITFSYEDGNKIFDNFSLKIEGGQKVGLVGYSGSGKTTMINLILRLFEPNSGCIEIDGQNILDITQKSLHEATIIVPQLPSLFDRSILDNIIYGNPDSEKKDFMYASKNAYVDEFVKEFPDKYEHFAGDMGNELSGGQRQRIAIARAFLKKAQILILDEATSSLDSKTEQYIQKSLSIMTKEKTVIAIAHRLSTLLIMDRIIVFNDGKIVQDGTHEELIKEDGLFKKLWEAQRGGFIFDE
jgi:ATP-binding cassette subfamily B protein